MNAVPRLSYDRAIRRGTEADPNPEILLATHGHFSEPFFRRTRLALELAPGLVQHIVTLKVAAGAASESRVQTTKEPPVPFNAQAWDDANHVYSLLVYWCGVWAPRLGTIVPTPARRSWTRADGKVVGLPANITAADARYISGALSAWLRVRLDPILALDPDDVTFFAENFSDVFRLLARWPQRDRATWSKLPCPRCDGRIAIYVPDAVVVPGKDRKNRIPLGGERRYVCEGCQLTLTDEEYQAEVDKVAIATKERQALVTKYGRQIPGEWRS